MVLYSKPCPALALYEQRSDSVPPYAPALHLELNAGLMIEPYGRKGDKSYNSNQSSIASMAASRQFDDSVHEHFRRGSITSLVSEGRGPGKSKKKMEETAFVIFRLGSENQSPFKVIFPSYQFIFIYINIRTFSFSWSFPSALQKKGMIGSLE